VLSLSEQSAVEHMPGEYVWLAGERQETGKTARKHLYHRPEEIKFTLNHWREAVQVQGYVDFSRFRLLNKMSVSCSSLPCHAVRVAQQAT
jgi:hypothetical protein